MNEIPGYLEVGSRLALKDWSDIEADGLDLPEESGCGAVLHDALHLQSQLLAALHRDRLAGRPRGRREGELERKNIYKMRELKNS